MAKKNIQFSALCCHLLWPRRCPKSRVIRQATCMCYTFAWAASFSLASSDQKIVSMCAYRFSREPSHINYSCLSPAVAYRDVGCSGSENKSWRVQASMSRHQIRMVSETRLKLFSFSLLNGLSSWFLAARRVQPPTRPRSRGHNCEGPVLTKKTQEMRRGKPRQGHARLFFSPFPRSIVFSHQSSKCTLILYIWLPWSSYLFWESRGTRFGAVFASCSRFLSHWAATRLRSIWLCLSDKSNLAGLSAVLVSCPSIGHLLGWLGS